MGAMTLGVIIVCALAGTYLYVMGLCRLCDIYEEKKLRKQKAEEKKRKDELRLALEMAEKKRRQEIQRRKELMAAKKKQSSQWMRQSTNRPLPNQGAQAAH